MLRIMMIVLATLSMSNAESKKITGDGKITTIQKSLPPFKSIKATGIGNIIISKEKTHKLNISAESNLITHLKVEVKDDTLHIGIEEGVSLNSKTSVDFYVSAPDIDRVSLCGATNLTLMKDVAFNKLKLRAEGSHLIQGNQLKAQELSVSIFGTVTIKIDGEVDILKIDSQGTSSIQLAALKTKNAIIESQGVDSIELNVQDFLKIHTLGVCHVTYKGNPKIKSRMSFTSSLRSVN